MRKNIEMLSLGPFQQPMCLSPSAFLVNEHLRRCSITSRLDQKNFKRSIVNAVVERGTEMLRKDGKFQKALLGTGEIGLLSATFFLLWFLFREENPNDSLPVGIISLAALTTSSMLLASAIQSYVEFIRRPNRALQVLSMILAGAILIICWKLVYIFLELHPDRTNVRGYLGALFALALYFIIRILSIVAMILRRNER